MRRDSVRERYHDRLGLHLSGDAGRQCRIGWLQLCWGSPGSGNNFPPLPFLQHLSVALQGGGGGVGGGWWFWDAKACRAGRASRATEGYSKKLPGLETVKGGILQALSFIPSLMPLFLCLCLNFQTINCYSFISSLCKQELRVLSFKLLAFKTSSGLRGHLNKFRDSVFSQQC